MDTRARATARAVGYAIAQIQQGLEYRIRENTDTDGHARAGSFVVVVDDGSDIGAGASIMGTLSGGGKQLVSIGKRCLLGANSGLGISLGDDCVVEAGTYITAGAKIRTPTGEVVKAAALSGTSGLLFSRNSLNGALEVIQRTGVWGELNPTLHVNQ